MQPTERQVLSSTYREVISYVDIEANRGIGAKVAVATRKIKGMLAALQLGQQDPESISHSFWIGQISEHGRLYSLDRCA